MLESLKNKVTYLKPFFRAIEPNWIAKYHRYSSYHVHSPNISKLKYFWENYRDYREAFYLHQPYLGFSWTAVFWFCSKKHLSRMLCKPSSTFIPLSYTCSMFIQAVMFDRMNGRSAEGGCSSVRSAAGQGMCWCCRTRLL